MAKPTPKTAVHRIAITKARVNLGQVVRRVSTNKECFILEKDGIPVAGIIDLDELEDYLELQDEKLASQIRQSYAEHQKGNSRGLDEFLSELDENRA